MMKSRIFIGVLMSVLVVFSCRKKTAEDKRPRMPISVQTREFDVADEIPEDAQKQKDSIVVIPVQHASFIMTLNQETIYVDPIGEAADYTDFEKPDIVLLTDIHADHFLPEVLSAVMDSTTTLIMPQAVYDKSPDSLRVAAKILKNGEETDFSGIHIKALPMYNLGAEAQKFHPQGRGNGYLLEADGKRIYISGDTEDIPEMRALKDIDLAFICMNLPYTMTVDQAVDAVLEFKPKKVYPYHYRGSEGFSDVDRFKKEVEDKNPNIQVEVLNWYPKN